MMRAGVLLGALVMAACGGGAEPEPAAEPEAPPSAGTIERLDPAFDALVPADAVIEEAGRRVRLHRGAGVGRRRRRVPAVQRHPRQPHRQVGPGRNRQRLPEPGLRG